jgi:hypothetical protein
VGPGTPGLLHHRLPHGGDRARHSGVPPAARPPTPSTSHCSASGARRRAAPLPPRRRESSRAGDRTAGPGRQLRVIPRRAVGRRWRSERGRERRRRPAAAARTQRRADSTERHLTGSGRGGASPSQAHMPPAAGRAQAERPASGSADGPGRPRAGSGHSAPGAARRSPAGAAGRRGAAGTAKTAVQRPTCCGCGWARAGRVS